MKVTIINPWQDLTWDHILRIGGNPTYYHIDRWLIAEGIDAAAISSLVFRRKNEWLIWRSVLLCDMHEWSTGKTVSKVGDSLSLRAFARITNLRNKPPSKSSIDSFISDNIKEIDNSLKLISAIWVSRDKKSANKDWMRLMDAWTSRIIRQAHITTLVRPSK